MYYIVIRFPFSSINDESYVLTVVLNSASQPDAAMDMLAKERDFFASGLTTTDGTDTIYNYEGTLTGGVKAMDDEREDMFEPLVCSKLSFNVAVNDFPTWLIDFCNNRCAKVVVHKIDSLGWLHEMWRGYLIDQALNLTVVNDKISVSLVAVDEVAMAKYINFKSSIQHVNGDRWCTLFTLMEYYHTLHHTQGL